MFIRIHLVFFETIQQENECHVFILLIYDQVSQQPINIITRVIKFAPETRSLIDFFFSNLTSLEKNFKSLIQIKQKKL